MFNLYKNKAIEYGFIILCPKYNIDEIKITSTVLKNNYSNAKFSYVVPKNCPLKIFDQIKQFGPVNQGKNSISSLINTGLENTLCEEWNFIITSGHWLKKI